MKIKVLLLIIILLMTACTSNNKNSVIEFVGTSDNCTEVATTDGDKIYRCDLDGQICYVVAGYQASAIDCVE